MQGNPREEIMSQYYRMRVEITGCGLKKKAIKTAAAKEWPFAEWEEDEVELGCSAESHLRDGEEEFAERLTVAIWRANGTYCEVLVTATYLENPPCELYQLDEDDYERLVVQEKTECVQPTSDEEVVQTLDYAIAHPTELDRELMSVGDGDFEAHVSHLGHIITIWRHDDDDESVYGWERAGKQNGEVLDSLEECLENCREHWAIRPVGGRRAPTAASGWASPM